MRLCRRLSWKLKGKLSRKINKIFVFLIVIATIVLGEWYIRPWEGGNLESYSDIRSGRQFCPAHDL